LHAFRDAALIDQRPFSDRSLRIRDVGQTAAGFDLGAARPEAR
jgi:hypothetical protein